MIEELQTYFSACPLFEGREVNIDYLAEQNGAVSISPKECEPVIKAYKTGGSLRQYCFEIAMRRCSRGSLGENLQNEILCENLANWLEEESEGGNLPSFSKNLSTQRIEIVCGGYDDKESPNYAVYKIGLRLVYLKM